MLPFSKNQIKMSGIVVIYVNQTPLPEILQKLQWNTAVEFLLINQARAKKCT